MSKLPIISGRQAVKKLERCGYQAVRQRGSHVRMLHPTDSSKKPLTVPMHSILGKGLLRKIIRESGLTVDDFAKL